MSSKLVQLSLVIYLNIVSPRKSDHSTTKTKTSLSKSEFELAKKSYLKIIKKAVSDAKIPAELVINWDQTGVNVVPAL